MARVRDFLARRDGVAQLAVLFEVVVGIAVLAAGFGFVRPAPRTGEGRQACTA